MSTKKLTGGGLNIYYARMKESTVVELLKKKQGARTQSDLARDLGMTPQYVSEVLKGQKPPSDRILEYLGLKREIVRAK